MPLFLGTNVIQMQAKNTQGASDMLTGAIDRLLIGDVNRSRNVDDADLSLFTRAWKTYKLLADFNEDALIDDADLSLFVNHWGNSY